MLLRKQAVLLQPESMGKTKWYNMNTAKTPKLLILRNKTLCLVRVRVPLSAHIRCLISNIDKKHGTEKVQNGMAI